MRTSRKAFAYITRGRELLIFSHPDFPEAGLKVPAGTIEEGETPEQGVLREAYEETGISGLRIVSFLGEQVRDMRDFGVEAFHHRYFFHLTTEAPVPETLRHFEKGGSEDPDIEGIAFDFFWVPLDGVPDLILDHGWYLDGLRAVLTERPPETTRPD